MQIIDGRVLAAEIQEELKREVAALPRAPRLAVLLVGDDPASHLYVSLKQKTAEAVGIRLAVHHLEASVPDERLIEMIGEWNRDPAVTAILVQFPLPEGHDETRVASAIRPDKDADGFHPDNVRALLEGRMSIVPPVHEGILRLVSRTPLQLPGATAVILANSDVFATPLKRLLGTAGASVDVVNPDELDFGLLKEADIVITAVGRLKFLTPDLVKDDAVIIDVGTNRALDGKIYGDADFEAFKKTNAWITPVPGGVGPMTIAQLLKNIVLLAKKEK